MSGIQVDIGARVLQRLHIADSGQRFIPKAFVEDFGRKKGKIHWAGLGDDIWGEVEGYPQEWGLSPVRSIEQRGEFSPKTLSYPQFSTSYPQKGLF